MQSILVTSSAKRITTQILVIAKLNGGRESISRGFDCDMIRFSRKLVAEPQE